MIPEPIAQGKAKAKVFLEENPAIAADLEKKLRERLFAPPGTDADEEIGGDDGIGSEDAVGEEGSGEDSDDQSSPDPSVTY